MKDMEKFEQLYQEAHQRAHQYSIEKCGKNLMVIPCGFAWINIKPGNSAFAKWLIKNQHARKDHYYGGVTIWVSDYNQSMHHKEAYAEKFTEVLIENGIRAYADSRLD